MQVADDARAVRSRGRRSPASGSNVALTGTSESSSSSASRPVATNAMKPAPRALAWRGLASWSIGRPTTSAMIDAQRSDWAPPPTNRIDPNSTPIACSTSSASQRICIEIPSSIARATSLVDVLSENPEQRAAMATIEGRRDANRTPTAGTARPTHPAARPPPPATACRTRAPPSTAVVAEHLRQRQLDQLAAQPAFGDDVVAVVERARHRDDETLGVDVAVRDDAR